MNRLPRIAIIGAGSVGGSIAYGLIMRKLVVEVLLVDMSVDLLHSQVLDLSEAAFGSMINVRAGTFREAGQADVIVMTAHSERMEGEQHSQWAERNRQLIHSVSNAMSPVQPKALIIVACEPVDLLTFFLQQDMHLPSKQIFGVGSVSLSTARVRDWLSHTSGVRDESKVEIYVIGTAKVPVVAWHSAKVNGKEPVSLFGHSLETDTLRQLTSEDRVHYVRAYKGGAWYGIGATIVRIVEHIITSSKPHIFVLSTYVERFHTCLSLPVVLGAEGILEEVKLALSQDEKEGLQLAATFNERQLISDV